MKVDKPVDVEALFDDQGRLTPKSFVFEGTGYRVHQVGRRWDEAEWQHTLVMSPDGQTWDLAYSTRLGAWRVKAHTQPGSGSLV